MGRAAAAPSRGPALRAASSHAPQPSSTSTSQGPMVAAETPPSERVPEPAPVGGRALPAGRREARRRRGAATAATAAPAPAPAPRTQSGGEPARNSAASARIRTSPGTMKLSPPTSAPRDAAARATRSRSRAGWRPVRGAGCRRRSRPRTRARSSQPRRCDAQLAQQRDVRRRAAEADAADAPPLAQDRCAAPAVVAGADRQLTSPRRAGTARSGCPRGRRAGSAGRPAR